MRKIESKKLGIMPKALDRRLSRLKRALRIGESSDAVSSFQPSQKEQSSTFIPYKEIQEIRVYLARMEKLKAEADWLVDRRNRYV